MGREQAAAILPREDVWRSDRGSLVIRYPARHVLVFKYEGHIGEAVVPFVATAVDRVLASGITPDIFVDLEHMSGYDSAYRIAITKWGSRVRKQLGQFMLLTRSRLVAMGVAVSNLAVGGSLSATTKRTEFDAAIAISVRRGPR
jgi:hypothetical protein